MAAMEQVKSLAMAYAKAIAMAWVRNVATAQAKTAATALDRNRFIAPLSTGCIWNLILLPPPSKFLAPGHGREISMLFFFLAEKA